MDDFERRWALMQQELARQASGEARPVFSSGRTLFGIRSTAEEKMDEFARQIEEEQLARRLAREAAERERQDGGDAEGREDPPVQTP